MATINYENKEAISVNPTIPNKNKVVDSDMNLIKQVGNQILTTMGVYTDDWNSATTYAIGEIAIYDNRIFKNLTGTNTATTPDQDTTNWEETTISSMAAGAASGDTLPIGSIVPYGTTTAPTNWLVCDGSAVSRTTYANLFAVIGTSFGSGDGSTTFNLPDLRGRVPVGQKDNDSDFDGMGVTGGEKTHILTIQEMPSHKHTMQDRGRLLYWDATLNNVGLKQGTGADIPVESTWNDNTANVGGGQAHNNLQPYQTVNYIIKAKQSAGVVANVSNTQSESTTDTYSCDYINGIVESGSNANGYYTKYADGTLICRYYIGPVDTNQGAGATKAVTFPYEFVDTNWQVSLTMTNGQAYWSQVASSISDKDKTGFNFKSWNDGGGNNTGQYWDYVAIGKWK